jgi:hypothetical protein
LQKVQVLFEQPLVSGRKYELASLGGRIISGLSKVITDILQANDFRMYSTTGQHPVSTA